MQDWTDDLYMQAKLTFPRLVPEINALVDNGDAHIVLDLLMKQYPRCFQC